MVGVKLVNISKRGPSGDPARKWTSFTHSESIDICFLRFTVVLDVLFGLSQADTT